MTTHTATSLGWTGGQNITTDFKAKIADNTLVAGDTLDLEGSTFTLDAGAQVNLPANFTLYGGAANTGLINIGTQDTIDHSINMESGCTLDNVRIACSFVGYQRPISILNKTDCTIINSEIAAPASMSNHVLVWAQNAANLRVIGSEIDGSVTQFRLNARTTGFHMYRCYSHGSGGDGIKTSKGSGADIGQGFQFGLIEYCHFAGHDRDSIDTTGGFQDTTVRKNVFMDSGLDLKIIFEEPAQLNVNTRVRNVDIEDNKFYDPEGAAVVGTTLDRGTDFAFGDHLLIPVGHPDEFLAPGSRTVYAPEAERAFDWCPQLINFTRNTVAKTIGQSKNIRVLTAKEIHTFTAVDMIAQGTLNADQIISAAAPPHSKVDLGLNTGITYTNTTTEAAPTRNATVRDADEVAFAYGRGAGYVAGTYHYSSGGPGVPLADSALVRTTISVGA